MNNLREGENVIGLEIHSGITSNPTVVMDVKLFDGFGITYFDFGSEWYYYDKGSAPANELGDKLTGIFAGDNSTLPGSIRLFDNYPDPFNPTTNISFTLNKRSGVELSIYNILGQLVKTLVNKELSAGKYTFKFDAANLASGVYIYRLRTGTFNGIKKMVILK